MVHFISISSLALITALNAPPASPPAPSVSAPPAAAPALATTTNPAKDKSAQRAALAAYAERVRHRNDHPAEAQEFFLRKRLPAGMKSLPMERYFTAHSHMQTMRQHSASQGAFLPSRAEVTAGTALPQGASGWSSLGPGDVGGRVLSLVINPQDSNTIYAGTADGGIWKTTDGGIWSPLNDFFPSLAIGSLAMDPANPDVLYAGTGEGSFNGDSVQGAGIFTTTDGGATWAQVAGTNTPDFNYVNSMAISSASGALYAATGTGVFQYDPHGAKWTPSLQPNTFLGCFSLALRVDSSQNDVLTAACGSFLQGGVFQNAQAQSAGGAWKLVLTNRAMGRTALAIAPSNPDVIYAVSASNADGPHHFYNQGMLGVYRSEQGGAAGTWTNQNDFYNKDLVSTLLLTNPVILVLGACGFGQGFALNQGWYDITIAVDPTNPDVLFVGGIDLFRSDNGGKTFGAMSYWWAQPDPEYSHADHHALAVDPNYNGTTNQVLFDGNDGGVFKTSNALAQTAAGSPTVLCNDANSQVSFTGLNNNFSATQFYAGAVFPDNSTYFGGTQDNGTVAGTDSSGANAWGTILGGDGGFTAVDPNQTNVLWAENTGLSIQKSIDGGKTFFGATAGIVDVNFLFINPFVLAQGSAAGSTGSSNTQVLYTGGRYLWRTKNGGNSWSRASSAIAGNPFQTATSAIASFPGDPNHVLLGVAAGEIHRNSSALTSSGNTPMPKSKPRPGFVSWLTFDPTNVNVAYATYSTFGGTHVWRSADGGATWTGIDGTGAGALPDLPVDSIAVDPANPTTLYIGTDLGVFVSTDSGQSWAVELTGFPNVVADDVLIQTGPGGSRSLYAFTHGRGAWRVNLP